MSKKNDFIYNQQESFKFSFVLTNIYEWSFKISLR